MIRKLLGAAVVASLVLSPVALAQDAQDAKYSTSKNTIGELVNNEKTNAVLVKHIPDLVANPQLEQGYDMKFVDIVQYVPDQLTEEKLKAIDADLAKVAD